MNGTHLTLGLVGALAAAGALSRRGSRATSPFTTGYCLAFAKVLKKHLGREAQIYDLVEPDAPGSISGTPHHAVVKWRGLYLDADGAFTEEELLARWDERAPTYVLRPLRLERHHAARARVYLKSSCPTHLMWSAEFTAKEVAEEARRRLGAGGAGSRAARKPKPTTLSDLNLPTTWFHGTGAAFTGPLRPNKGMGGACVWLADREGAQAYAQGQRGRLIEVRLAPDTKVVDLSNASDPIVREFIRLDRSASNMLWHGREEVMRREVGAASRAGSLNLAAVQRLRAALRASSGSANVIGEPKPRASRKKAAPQDAAVAEMLRLDPKDVPDELLVAVLLMGAVKGDPVKVARETLDELGGNLQRVLRAQAFDARGLEPLSRARMVATRELVRRANLRGVLAGDGPVLDSPDKVYDVARALSTGARERLTAMYLNNKNRVLGTREISLGTHRYTLADPVQVFRPAVEMNATSVILVHNHPSGEAAPSGPDHELTRAMVSAGKTLQIALLDHVIVTPVDQYSFRAAGSIY